MSKSKNHYAIRQSRASQPELACQALPGHTIRVKAKLLGLCFCLAALAPAAICLTPASAADATLPQLRRQGTATRLMVDDQPFIMLAGELHNSSSSSLEYLRPIWPKLAALNLNTVIASVSWELVEPEEGKFDFTLVDGLLSAARRQDLKLVLIWFATWKNGEGAYAPAWVKTNCPRFPRCQPVAGRNSTQLTAMSEDNCNADARAFAALMRHLHREDAKRHTVLMMQVENEPGIMPAARDHCAAAEAAFAGPVPAELMRYLLANKDRLLLETTEAWSAGNFRESGTWSEVFGSDAEEIFSAWHIGRYIGRVAAAGKAEYPVPMYANAWLVQHRGQKPGQYPSGGPVARMMDIWRAAAPAIDLLAPDIYLDDFKGVCSDYARSTNPLFIPEASRDDRAGLRAYYAFGSHHALGFSPFGIDSLSATNVLGEHYALLRGLLPLLSAHQGKDTLKGFLQAADELKIDFDIGDFHAEVGYSTPGERPAAGLLIATAPDTFVVAGANFNLRFAPRRGQPGNTAWLFVEEGVWREGKWVPGRRLNGDEAGAKLNLGAKPRTLLARVYRFPSE